MPALENLPAAPRAERAEGTGGGGPSYRRIGRDFALGTLGAILLVLLMAFPASAGLAPAGSAGPASAPAGLLPIGTSHAPAVSAVPPPPQSNSMPPILPGLGVATPNSPSQHPVFPLIPNQFVIAQKQKEAAASAHPASTVPSGGSAPVAFGPAAGGGPYRTATFDGFVRDARTNASIPGAHVDWASGSICPSSACPEGVNTIQPAGSFSVVAPAPTETLTAHANGYLDNFTVISNVVPGAVYTGIYIYLTKEGTISGLIEGSDPTHERVSCSVLISSESRSGLTIGQNYTVTGGTFSGIPVPPFPTEVTFSPLCAEYEANWYWVNVTAYPAFFNIGVVYLPVNDRIQATVYDSVTKKPVTQSEIQVCPYQNPGNCALKGPNTYTDHPIAWGAPGYDVMTVWAMVTITVSGQQYTVQALVNTTMIGYVPPLPPSKIWAINPVYVVPPGIAELDVGLTNDRQIVAHHVTASWSDAGYAVVSSSSLDGYTSWSNFNPLTGNFSSNTITPACLTIGALSLILVAPLRNSLKVEPDTGGTCTGTPTWPLPDFLPVWGNQTIVNVSLNTSQHAVIPGGGPGDWFNLSAGTYVEIACYGNAADPSPSISDPQNPACSAADQPTDYTGLGESWVSEPTASPAPPRSPVNYAVPGCLYPSWFVICVPVQFGPSKITITDTTQSGTSFENFTWIDVPAGDYGTSPTTTSPLRVDDVSTEKFTDVGSAGQPVSSGGVGGLEFLNTSVYGRIFINGTSSAVYGEATIVITPAGALASVPYIGQSTVIANATNGDYSVASPTGWVEVQVSDPLYEQNWTWVYIRPGPIILATGNPAPINIGTIYLTPLATVQGQVLTGGGAPIYQAKAQYCAISSAKCTDLGVTGTTNTYGEYSGLLAADPLPLGAYRLVFSAAGYVTNMTWVTVTVPGQIYTASTIRLYSTVTAAPSRVAPAASRPSNAASLAEWVVGNVIDNVTGLPPASIQVSWSAPGGIPAQLGANDINALDDFNTSIPVGVYYLNFSSPIYFPVSVLVNVSGQDLFGTDFLTTVTMQPYPFFTGRVDIGPGNWTYLSQTDGLGPGDTTATILDQTRTERGPAETVNSGGFFNVSGPYPLNPKQHDLVEVVPQTPGTGGTATGGFTQSTFNVAAPQGAPYINVTQVPILNVFGIAYSFIRDASTNNSTPVHYPTASLLEYQVSGKKVSPSGNTTPMIGGAGGLVIGITPAWNATPGKPGYFNISITTTPSAFAYFGGVIPNGTVDWGSIVDRPNMSLVHFGWVAGTIANSVTQAPVPYAAVEVSTLSGPMSALVNTTTSGAANGGGFVNLTAAPGHSGYLNVSAPDYNNTVARYFSVNESQTTSITKLLSTASVAGGLEAWGWVRGQVLDNTNKTPLFDATVQVVGRYGTSGNLVSTNQTGGYFTDAPVGPGANVSLSLVDYLGNFTHQSIASSLVANASPVQMTGDGIIAGIVVGYPSGGAVGFANLSLCAGKDTVCVNDEGSANGSGVFWISGPPGLDTLTVSFSNYVTTSITVNITSDSWQWVGPIDLDEYAYLTGEVIGLPTGTPIDGANVSTCSVLAYEEGALICPYATATNGAGLFSLAVPAGDYILQANATFFNSSFLPVQFSPGENVSLGLIELEAYGLGTGTVLGADTLQPVPGTLVNICPTWTVGNCTSTSTDLNGQYNFDGPPGPYQITATGGAYLPASTVYKLESDVLVTVPTLYLEPVGPGNRFTVQGTVYAEATVNGNPPVAFAGAVIADNVGDTASTDSAGHYSLSVAYGSYTVTVIALGYRAASERLIVHGNATGLDFTLAPMTYTFSGYVTDGVSGKPLKGINIALGGLTLAQTSDGGTSGPLGYYSFLLQNGSYKLTASYPAIDVQASEFAAVSFAAVVNGANASRDVALFPPSRNLIVDVVDGPSGIPIANASVVATGLVLPELVNENFVGSTNTNGTVEIQSYTGNYTVTAAANGYLTKSVPLPAPANGSPTIRLTIELSPVPPTVAGATGLNPAIGAALAGGVVALAAGVFLLTRRLSATSRAAPPSQG